MRNLDQIGSVIMTGWETWVIALSIGVIALMFVVLSVFLVILLVSLRRTVKTANSICTDLEGKIHAFDPVFNVVSGIGHAVEKRTACVRQLSKEVEESVVQEKQEREAGVLNTALEVAEWTLIGMALWQKIKERRK